MPKNIGPHLLGRRYEADERDSKYPMSLALGDSAPDGFLDMTVRDAIDKTSFFTTWTGILALWRWLKANILNKPNPSPPPTPTPDPTEAVTSMVWEDATQLDQGDTGHCVGFGWTGWLDGKPVEHTFDNAYADAYYYDCKIVDGEPKQENGSSVRSGATVAQQRKFVANYVWAQSVTDMKAWLLTKGPVVCGSDWTSHMFTPDPQGYVNPTGRVEGGHCYLCIGYDTPSDTFLFQNSWGSEWGLSGRFKMKASAFARLLKQQGEACAGVELPVTV